jgi:serralysin
VQADPTTLSGTLTGVVAINGTGNTGANTITGNGAANVLNGNAGDDALFGGTGNDILKGGTGKDTLTGGAGMDRFDFDMALNASTNVDRITDFNAVNDVVRLDDDTFIGLATGTLASGRFYSAPGATTAHDANDRIIYNSSTGNLFYDADGLGGAAAMRFATLAGAPTISAADFFVVA